MRRGFDLAECRSPSLDVVDDLVSGPGPDEGLGVVVPMLDPQTDGLREFDDAAEHTSPQAAVSDQREAALAQVQPARARGGEVGLNAPGLVRPASRDLGARARHAVKRAPVGLGYFLVSTPQRAGRAWHSPTSLPLRA